MGGKLDFVPYIGKYMAEGKNRDFTYQWYKQIGGLFIVRMIILNFKPL